MVLPLEESITKSKIKNNTKNTENLKSIKLKDKQCYYAICEAYRGLLRIRVINRFIALKTLGI